jgi:hypothetical protein
LSLLSTVDKSGLEVRSLIDQPHVVFYTDLSGRNEDGLTSVLLVSDGVAAITDAVYSYCLCLGCHPLTYNT